MSPKIRNAARAIGLLRVSTDEKRQDNGLQAQREAIVRWAEQNDVEIVAWRQDTASGGATLEERPGLGEALGLLGELDAGILVVAKRDRLARSMAMSVGVEAAVRRVGARVVSVAGEGSGDEPADELLRTLLDAVAVFERATMRARIRAALAVKKARGELTGKAPFGMRPVGPPGRGRRLEPDPAEQAVLERVRALRASGLPYRAVASQLASEGIVGRAGKPLAHSAVANMLKGVGP